MLRLPTVKQERLTEMRPMSMGFSALRARGGRPRGTIAAIFVIVMVLVAAGCGKSKSTSSSTTPATSSATPATATANGTVNVTLDEYTVKPTPTGATAGKVTFKAKNIGNANHEMIVIKTDLAEDKLPTEKGDSTRIDEAGPGLDAVGEVPELRPGKSGSVSLDLKPGKYVLICNVAGHYASGQHTTFNVK
jgi:uncharacterized cupredoxin-like copper-binding protein